MKEKSRALRLNYLGSCFFYLLQHLCPFTHLSFFSSDCVFYASDDRKDKIVKPCKKKVRQANKINANLINRENVK